MAVTIAGTALKKMTHNGQAVKKWVHDGVQVFSAEEIIIPNPTDYPSSIYDVTMLNSGGTLTVDSSGAMVKTTSTDYGQKHLACLRIERARALITSTNKSNSEICYECGFGSERSYIRQFKSIMGFTPSEYRKKYFIGPVEGPKTEYFD